MEPARVDGVSMAIRLNAIKFNHDPNSLDADAINLRRNGSEFIAVPEWQAGISLNPEDSPAAYAVEETAGNTITIQASMNWTGSTPATVEIRALDLEIDPLGPSGCIGLLARILSWILGPLIGNVLGVVSARSVTFSASGVSAYETFELDKTRLHASGVGVHMTSWRWQYREAGGPWTDFDVSRHRIYVLLREPTAPWEQQPYASTNLQLVWSDVLDKACNWAASTADPVAAATAVTTSVFELGNSVITYDCPGGGATQYALPNFDCTAFLERMAGGPGNGQYVNCTDCATIVSSFANAIGCDLWQSRMGWGFDLNPLLAIGSNTWQTACGWGGFSYHEVPWTDGCTEVDEVYDACLQVDDDADPTSPPHTPLQPANIVFGTPGSGGYRDKLSPGGNCDPLPASRVRRTVF